MSIQVLLQNMQVSAELILANCMKHPKRQNGHKRGTSTNSDYHHYSTRTRNQVTCLLKTAVTRVNTGGLHAEANILFDKGAQRSFISDKLPNELKISPQLTENVNITKHHPPDN